MKKRMLALAVVTALCLGCLISHVTIGAGAAPLEEDGRLYANFADTAGWVTGNYDKTPTGTAAEGDLRLKSVSADGKSAGIDPRTLMGTAYYEVTVDLSKYDTVSWSWSENTGASVCAGILEGDSLGAELNGGGRVVGKWGDGISPDKTGSVSLNIAKIWGSSGTKTLKFFVGTWNNGAGSAVGADYRYRIENLCLSSSKAPIPAGPIVEDGKLYANFADKEGWIENYYGGSGEQALTADGLWDISDMTADGKGATLVRSDDVEGAPGAAYPAFAVYKATVDLSKYDTVYYSFEADFEGSRIGVSNTKSIFADKYANYTGAGSTGELDLAAVFGSTGEKELYFYVGMWNAGKGTGAKINYLYLGKKPAEPEEPLGPITEGGRLYANFKDKSGWVETVYANGGTTTPLGQNMAMLNVSGDGKSAWVGKKAGVAADVQAFALYKITVDLSKYDTLYVDATYAGPGGRLGITDKPSVFVGDNPINFSAPYTGGTLLQGDLAAAYGTSGEKELYVYVGLFNAGGGDGVTVNAIYLGKKPLGPIAEDGKLYANFKDADFWIENYYGGSGEQALTADGLWDISDMTADGKGATLVRADEVGGQSAGFPAFAVYKVTADLSQYNTLYYDFVTDFADSRIGVSNTKAVYADKYANYTGTGKTGKLDLTAAFGKTGEQELYIYFGAWNAGKGTGAKINSLSLGFEEIPKYTVTVNAQEGGTASGGATVERGDSVTLTATAEENYVFTGWYAGETKVSDEATYTFAPDADITLTAHFASTVVKYTLTVNAQEGGTVDNVSGTYEAGTKVKLKATADDTHRFAGWYKGEQKIADTAEYSYTVSEAVTLTAHFTEKPKATPVDPNPDEEIKIWNSCDLYAEFFAFGQVNDVLGSDNDFFTEGTGSMRFVQNGQMMIQYVPAENFIDTTGYNTFVFDLWVDDPEFFKNSLDLRVSLSSSKLKSGQADDCALVWWKALQNLKAGWNHIELNMESPDAQNVNFRDQPTFNPKDVRYLRIWADGQYVTDKETERVWRIDRIGFKNKATEPAERDNMWHSGDVYADFFGFGDAGDIAVGSSTAQKTEGTGSLYVTQKGKMMMQVVRKFDATGYNRLVFDLYVPDKDFFKQSTDNRVSLSSSKLGTGQADDCSLTWFLSRMELTEGWNHIVLDMDHPDAQTLNFRDQPTYAPAETGYLRIWADGANVTDQDKELTWYLDDLHFEKADTDTSDEDSSKAGEDSSGTGSSDGSDSSDNPATGAALPVGAAAAAVLAAAAAVVGRKRRSR